MSKTLIIVESPTKIKTLKKFLNGDYLFESSLGHIIDLPAKEFGIDVDHDFTPKYTVVPGKEKVIAQLKKAGMACDEILLAPDPDREGEAIAWHIASLFSEEDKRVARITFHSITKDAVLESLHHPRKIDEDLVNAQQTRRLLDRMVGYKISPLLNRRVSKGGQRGSFLSAGRVQSVALKLIVLREEEIERFVPVEYWKIHAHLQAKEGSFVAMLYRIDGLRVEKEQQPGKEQTTVGNKERADAVLQRLEGAVYAISKVEKKQRKRSPAAPFITSTLQQEASRHFGFSATRTMRIAQDLYEGIELGQEGQEGLITYMRTDSTRLAPEAVSQCREWIKQRFSLDHLPEKPNVYGGKKNAQDAHEAIRPASLQHPPESVRPFLTKEQWQLYTLIWNRFIASQMQPAIYDTVAIDVTTDKKIDFHATGATLRFPGFLAIYEEREDEEQRQEQKLPNLAEGEQVDLLKLTSEQSFTKPPPRFTEASLVKELERLNIGRPSTYASIMQKIQSREYTEKEQQRLRPTELGRVIVALLENHFEKIMNVAFTAEMEEELERIAEHKQDWKEVLKTFWGQFAPMVSLAEQNAFVPKVLTDLDCPKCGTKLHKIWAHGKYFLGCSRYPDCDYSAPLGEACINKEAFAPDFDWEQSCPLCSKPMKLRQGRYGPFLGCSDYPKCKGIINIPTKAEKEQPEIVCPAIGCSGKIVCRKSRFGKLFYACSTYPECDVIANSVQQLEEKYANHPRMPAAPKVQRGKRSAAVTSKTKTTKPSMKKTMKRGGVKDA